MKWGEATLTIVEKADGTLKVRFPATIEQTDPVVQSAALTAEYGIPAQVVTLAAAWRLDTTPSATVLVPEASSMTAVDGGSDNKFYLGKTVTVAGMNLMAVEGIELRYNDGEDRKIAATLLEGTTDGELKFVVPEEVTFDTASEVDVVALYNGGDVADFGKATVYPFYFFPNITIGAQDLSNRDKAFFVPDLGRVITSDEWKTLDTKASTNVMSAKNVVDKSVVTEEEYYAVKPYFMSTFTGNVLTLQSPAGSNGQLKNIKDSDGKNITADRRPRGMERRSASTATFRPALRRQRKKSWRTLKPGRLPRWRRFLISPRPRHRNMPHRRPRPSTRGRSLSWSIRLIHLERVPA